jgi:hypothetical protein
MMLPYNCMVFNDPIAGSITFEYTHTFYESVFPLRAWIAVDPAGNTLTSIFLPTYSDGNRSWEAYGNPDGPTPMNQAKDGVKIFRLIERRGAIIDIPLDDMPGTDVHAKEVGVF